jgi:hypothetical protein
MLDLKNTDIFIPRSQGVTFDLEYLKNCIFNFIGKKHVKQ